MQFKGIKRGVYIKTMYFLPRLKYLKMALTASSPSNIEHHHPDFIVSLNLEVRWVELHIGVPL